MPVMHPVVARDDLASLSARQDAALQPLKRRIGRSGPYHHIAKIAIVLALFFRNFLLKTCEVCGRHRMHLLKIQRTIVGRTRTATQLINCDSNNISVVDRTIFAQSTEGVAKKHQTS
jgi:hypothetical protein